MAWGPATTTAAVPDEAFGEVASALVQAGRVVPGLTVEADGRARSWWWPLPAASHRTLCPYRPVIHHQPLHRKVTEIAGREARSHSESGCCREAVGLT